MGIGNVLNIKAESGGQQAPQQGTTPELQQQRPGQQLQQLQVDRQGSPQGSEQSRYSGPMSASYPSPTAMAPAPLPPVPNANMAPAPMVPHEMQQNIGVVHPAYQQTQPAPQPPAHQPPAKQFPCSTCGKPFARRSDLARHGKRGCVISLSLSLVLWLTPRQNAFTVASGPMFATILGAASSSFNGLL